MSLPRPPGAAGWPPLSPSSPMRDTRRGGAGRSSTEMPRCVGLGSGGHPKRRARNRFSSPSRLESSARIGPRTRPSARTTRRVRSVAPRTPRALASGARTPKPAHPGRRGSRTHSQRWRGAEGGEEVAVGESVPLRAAREEGRAPGRRTRDRRARLEQRLTLRQRTGHGTARAAETRRLGRSVESQAREL